MQYPSDITRAQFNTIAQILEGAKKKTKPRKHDIYIIFSTHCCTSQKQGANGEHCRRTTRTSVLDVVLKKSVERERINNGRIAVDTKGLPHAVHVTAASATDRNDQKEQAKPCCREESAC